MFDFENVSKNCEYRYRLLISNISDVMMEIDLDGTITYLSPQVYNILGYYPEELVGLTLYDIINPLDLDPVKGNIENFNEPVETNSISFQIKHKKTYFLDVSAKTAMINVNGVKTIIILIRNITEKNKIEEKLEWSEEKYRDLYENAPNAYLSIGTNKKIRRCNKVTEKLLNYTKKELLTMEVFDLYAHTKDGITKAKNIFQRFLKGDVTQDEELQMKKKNGEYIWISLSVIPIKEKEGNLIETRSMIIDITKRKIAEQKLKEYQENLELKIRKRTNDLTEQVKELTCIYELSNLFENPNNTVEDIIRGTLKLIPPAWQFPTITCARIIFDKNKFTEDTFRESKWKLSIITEINKKDLKIEVFYLEDKLFLEEEINLLEEISIRLKNHIETRKIQNELRASEHELKMIYENAPVLMVLVDEERRVRKANNLALKFANRFEEEMLGLRGGEALRCLNALNDPRGCGFSPECQLCNVRNIVLDTFKTGTSFHDIEVRLPFFRDNKKKHLNLIVSSVPIEIQGEKLALVTIKDISNLKDAEQRLKESEVKLRGIMDSITDQICILDKNLDFLYINSVAEEIYGPSALGSKCYQIYHRLDEPCSDCQVRRTFEDSEVHDKECIRRIGEESRYCWCVSSVFERDKEGRPISVVEVSRDITERKLKEKELHLQSAIITNLSDGVHLIRVSDGTISYTNPRFEEMFGYDPGEMIGENIAIINAPTDMTPEETREEIMEIMLETGEWHGEILNIKKNGTPFWCYANVSFFDHPEYGEVIVAVHTDITERKEKEDELRAHSQIMTNLSEGVYLIRLEDLIIVYANPRFDEMFGYDPGEIIGQNVVIVNAQTDKTPEETTNEILGILKDIGEWHGEILNIKKDGTRFWCYANISLFDHPEYGGVILSILTDITERKMAEEKVFELARFTSENPNPVLRVNDHKVIFVNKASQNQFSIQENDQIPEFLQEDVKKALAKDTLINIEVDFRSHIFSFVIIPIREENYVNIYGRDITERKKAETRIIESEKNLKSILEAVPIGITITTPNGELVDFNSAIYRIFGYSSKEEFRNVPIINHYYDPKDREKFVKLHEKGDIKDFECQFKRKDGTILWGSMTSTSENIGYQDIFINTFQDITERRKYEEEILDMAKFPTENPYPVLRVTEEFVLFSNKAGEQLFNTKIGNRIPISLRNIVKKAFLKKIIQNIEVNFNKRDYSLFVTSIEGTNYANIYGLDITESKLVEKKLEEQYEFLSNVIEALTHPFSVINIEDYSVEMTNSSSKSVFGSDKMKCYNLHHNSKTPCKGDHICPIEEVKKTNKAVTTEHIHYDKQGNPRFFEVHGYPLFDKDGNIKQMIEYTLDITERKQAEEKVKQSEEKFRNMSESAQDAIIQVNDEGKITFWNRTAENMFQFTENDVLEKKMSLLIIPKRYRKVFNEGFKKFKINGSGDIVGRTVELTALKKDGNEFPIEISISSVISKENWTSIAIIRDISKRKKSEVKLKESEEKFRTLTEQSLLGIYILQEDKIIYANQEISNLLGYSIEEITNWKPGKYMILYQSEDKECVSQILENSQDGDEDFTSQFESQCIRKSGEIIWLKSYLKPITFEGKPAIMVTSINITEKKELDEIKSNLLTRFSHEFKTPLISIRGFSELLLAEYADLFDKQVISFLNRIKTGGNRLANLVNSFLESSQLDGNRAKLNLNKNNLATLIRDSVKQLEGLIHLRDHTINLEIQDDLVLEFDEDKIYAVINNLLLNAINYTPIGGTILINSKLKKDFVLISIKDSGIGLSKKDKNHLFEPFGKIERYGKGWDIMSEGMGMGLYISKEFIDLHKGKLWAESEGRNKGSTFIFSLPIVN